MKESKLRQALTILIDLIWSGILWCLCSLPVLTIGPASSALYYAVAKCVRHERGGLTRVFFKGFRQSFRQGFPMGLLYLALAVLALVDVYVYSHMGLQNGAELAALGGALLVPLVLSFPWMFAAISRFENSFGGMLRFVFFLSFRNLGRSLVLALELAGFLVVVWLIPELLPLLPGAFALLMSLMIEPVFRSYTLDQGAGEDDWYNE